MTKEDIRIEARQKRALLATAEVELRSRKIASLLFSRIPVHRFSVVHIFLPIRKNREPDTYPVLETLQRDFPASIYISKSLENGEMLHIPYTTGLALQKNRWGIDEPVDLSQALDSPAFFRAFSGENILVLIPLLAFDKEGYRVGYGKGYYDRFLSHSGANTTKTGLSLLEPVEHISHPSPLDIRMDYCITPGKIWKW
ncbi:MAG: 5-formyltetrahydrofolate cyclo-ligase [Leadbetterella sp.]|nr:5-formyltetrahydrofolate cyclo-ligase [Leadbetterella sp.]